MWVAGPKLLGDVLQLSDHPAWSEWHLNSAPIGDASTSGSGLTHCTITPAPMQQPFQAFLLPILSHCCFCFHSFPYITPLSTREESRDVDAECSYVYKHDQKEAGTGQGLLLFLVGCLMLHSSSPPAPVYPQVSPYHPHLRI